MSLYGLVWAGMGWFGRPFGPYSPSAPAVLGSLGGSRVSKAHCYADWILTPQKLLGVAYALGLIFEYLKAHVKAVTFKWLLSF